MPRRDEGHMESRRQQILEAAWRCFARTGVQAATMRAIAMEAGISTGALYVHFASKQAIIDSVFDTSAQRIEQMGSQMAAADPVDALDSLVPAFFLPLDDPGSRDATGAAIALVAETVRNDGMRQRYREQIAAMQEAIATPLRALQKADRLDADIDASLAARVLLCIHEGFRIHKYVDPDLPTSAFVETMSALLLGDKR